MKKMKLFFHKNYIICLVLFFCLLLSICFTGVYAKFISNASNDEKVNAAKFNISTIVATDQLNDFSLSEDNTTAIYTFSVTSDSEVAIAYDVLITLPSALPNGVTITIDGVTPIVQGFVYTLTQAGILYANDGSKTHYITISATDFSTDVTFSNINISVVASQINEI